MYERLQAVSREPDNGRPGRSIGLEQDVAASAEDLYGFRHFGDGQPAGRSEAQDTVHHRRARPHAAGYAGDRPHRTVPESSKPDLGRTNLGGCAYREKKTYIETHFRVSLS